VLKILSKIKGVVEFFFVMSLRTPVATLALGSRPRQRGLQGYGPRGRKPGSQGKGIARLWQKEARRPRQEEVRELRQEEARESHHILPGVLESVREYEGVNPHIPNATPTLGDGVPVDSRNFKEQLQGSKLNEL